MNCAIGSLANTTSLRLIFVNFIVLGQNLKLISRFQRSHWIFRIRVLPHLVLLKPDNFLPIFFGLILQLLNFKLLLFELILSFLHLPLKISQLYFKLVIRGHVSNNNKGKNKEDENDEKWLNASYIPALGAKRRRLMNFLKFCPPHIS